MRKPGVGGGAGAGCFQFREVVKELVIWKGTEGAAISGRGRAGEWTLLTGTLILSSFK